MTDFDMDAYLAKKFAEVDETQANAGKKDLLGNAVDALTKKAQQVAKATQEKIQSLVTKDPKKSDFDNTLVGKINSYSDSPVVDTKSVGNVLVNMGAMAASTTARIAANSATLPIAAKNANWDQQIPDDYKMAYDRLAKNLLDPYNNWMEPGDQEKLNEPSQVPYYEIIPSSDPLKKRATKLGPQRMATYGELMDAYQSNLKKMDGINKSGDISHIVERTSAGELSDSLKSRWTDNEKQFKEAGQNWDKGDYLHAIANGLKGGFNYVENVGRSIGENPLSVPYGVAENVPQTAAALAAGAVAGPIGAIGATGVIAGGYANALDVEGKLNQTKETGLPYGDLDAKRNRTLAAVGAGALEVVGDLVPVSAISKATAAIKNARKVGASAAAGATEQIGGNAIKAGLSTGSKEIAKGIAVESGTEFLQSPLEDQAQNQQYDPFNQLVSTTMAAAGTAGMVSPAGIVQGIAKAGQTAKENQWLATKPAREFYEASVKNDPSKYMDEKSDSYDLGKAAGVYTYHGLMDETPIETKQENLDKIGEIKSTIEAKMEEAKQANDAATYDGLVKDLEKVNALQESLGNVIEVAKTKQEEEANKPQMTAEEITAHGQERLDALNKKAEGTPQTETTMPDGTKKIEGGTYAQALTQDEVAERDFLTKNLDKPEELARVYGARLSETKQENPAKVESRIADLVSNSGYHSEVVTPLKTIIGRLEAIRANPDTATNDVFTDPEVKKQFQGLLDAAVDPKNSEEHRKSAQLAVSHFLNVVDQTSTFIGTKEDANHAVHELNKTSTTLGNVLGSFLENGSNDPVMHAIARAVNQVAGNTVVHTSSDDIDSDGYFHTTNGNIVINTKMLSGGNVHTLLGLTLHEGTHAATISAMLRNKKLQQAVYDLMEHVLEQNPALLKAYGMKNTLEFLAEAFSNRGFQQELSQISASPKVEKYLGKTLANAWVTFVELVRNALNLDPSAQNALTQVIELGGRAMKETASTGTVTVPKQILDESLNNLLVSANQMREVYERIVATDVSPEVKQALQNEINDLKTVDHNARFTATQLMRIATLAHYAENGYADSITIDRINNALQSELGEYSIDDVSIVKKQTEEVKGEEKETGKLSVFNEKDDPSITEYDQINLIRRFFTQNMGKETDGSLRPLVAVKDFLSKISEDTDAVLGFLKEKNLTEAQWTAINNFISNAKKWNPLVQKAFFKEANSKFYRRNPIQFLIQEITDENGNKIFDSDENLKTAISLGAQMLIMEMASNGRYNNYDTINRILQKDKGSRVPREAVDLLAEAGTRDTLLRMSAGQVVYQALGLKAKNIPEGLDAKLQAVFGAYVEHLLIEQGFLKRTEIPNHKLAGFMEAEALQYDEYGHQTFFALNRDENGELIAPIQKIVESIRGSQSVLDKLFSVESAVTMPSLTPFTTDQTRIKKTTREVPENLEKTRKKKQKEENKLREDMWHLLDAFSEEFILRMAGKELDDPKFVHNDVLKNVKAKNDALTRELKNYFDLGYMLMNSGDKTLGQSFYLDFSIWLTQRVGISVNGFNPQASKLHRGLTYQPDWETVVDLNNEASMNNFLLRIAEGFGIKTDAELSEVILPAFKEYIKSDELLNQAVGLIQERIYDDKEKFSDAEQALIAEAVKEGKENIHSLNSLVGLAHMQQAIKEGKSTFTVQIPAEVDGKVNGAMFSTVLFGAASNLGLMFQKLARGGFYGKYSKESQFNAWKAKGNQDLYENTISGVWKRLQKLLDESSNYEIDKKMLDTIQYFTGTLVNDKGIVESAGRKIIKGPTTQINFGSSIFKTVDNMGEAFVYTVYDKISKVAQNPTDENRLELIRNLNTLFDGKSRILETTTMQELLKEPITIKEQRALVDSFVSMFNEPIQEEIRSEFEVYLDRRDKFNNVAQNVFAIYNAAYQQVRNEYIQENLGKTIAVTVLTRKDPESGKVTERRVPQHDLTADQEAEVQARVAALFPQMNTLFSKEADNLDAGLEMKKSKKEISTDSDKVAEVKFNTPIKNKGTKSTRAKGFEINFIQPGVGLTPLSTHSLDSYVSHTVQEVMGVLNVHDALVAGVGNIQEAAKQLNQATFNALLKYDPMSEMYAQLERTIEGIHQILNDPKSSFELKRAIVTAIMEQSEDRRSKVKGSSYDYLTRLAELIREESYEASKMRLEFLRDLKYIDQYTFEGGAYELTKEDHAAVAEALAELEKFDSKVSEKTSGYLKDIEKSIQKFYEESSQRVKQAITEKEVNDKKEALLRFSNAQSLQLLDQAIKDESLSEAARAKLKDIFKAMLTGKKTLAEAVTEILGTERRASVVEFLYNRFKQIPEDLWGMRGKPQIESDPFWVDTFNKRANLTGSQLVSQLQKKIQMEGGAKNVMDFRLELLKSISGLISPNLTIRYVTPATATKQVIQQAKSSSQAWFVSLQDKDVIYVLSPDYKNSGLTTETLLHEVLHAALARTLQAEREKLAKNPNYTSPALEMMNELEKLRVKAEAFINENGLVQFAPAIENIDELISWGMTNLEFQRQVMSKISMQSKTKKTMVDGLKTFIDTLVGFLFRNSSRTRQAIAVNGMTVLINNVSGLFDVAANQERQSIDAIINLSKKNKPNPAFYNTAEIFNVLQPASLSFQKQLGKLLTGIVEKVHGSTGSFTRATMTRGNISPRDAYLQALATGQAPFASKIIASGFIFSEQEQFVMEQVEAALRATLDRKTTSTTYAYDALQQLYEEAKVKLQPRDFHDGAWGIATPEEKRLAQELYDFMFKVDPVNGDMSTHLSRFAALGLANEQVSKLLNFKTAPDKRTNSNPQTLLEKLQDWFEQFLNWIHNRITGVKPGERADERLMTLAESLASIENKKRRSEAERQNAVFDYLEKKTDAALNKVKNTVNNAANSPGVTQSRNSFIRGLGGAISAVAEGRVDAVIQEGLDFHNKTRTVKNNLFTDTVNYVRGPMKEFEELFRLGKKIEGDRKDYITQTTKNVLAAFQNNGRDLTKKEKQAITQLFLRTDMQRIYQEYSFDDIHAMLSSNGQLDAFIKDLEDKLAGMQGFTPEQLRQAKALGYFMIYGGNGTVEALMLNAHNIARNYGDLRMLGKVTPELQARELEKVLDPLISMYAIRYASLQERRTASSVLSQEMNRTDGENGFETVLKLHQYLLKDAKEKLFDGMDVHMVKGYIPDSLNSHTQVAIANASEGKDLILAGYTFVYPLPKDPTDKYTDEVGLYVLRDAGLLSHPSGMISLTHARHKGTKLFGFFDPNTLSGNINASDLDTMIQDKAYVMSRSAPSADFDPFDMDRHSIPVLDQQGRIVDFRYMMRNSTKDSVLERNNAFEHLLGVMAGNTFDKVATKKQNKTVIDALWEFYQHDYPLRPESYVNIGPNSPQKEYREMWALLPREAKEQIESLWGDGGIVVRADMVNLAFGYRKYSLSEIWDKPEAVRGEFEKVFVAAVEMLLAFHARTTLNMNSADAQKYAKRGAVAVRRAEDGWKYLSDTVKNAVVVKNGITLVGNIWSNITLLLMHDISLGEIVKSHQEAFRAARMYQEDAEELFALQQKLDIGLDNLNRQSTEERILILKDRIARNPVTELMDAGLMPTIVRDIDFTEDDYKFKSSFEKHIDKNIADLDPLVQKIGRNLFMTKDTPQYKFMAEATQLSDFVARYTLYQNLISRKKNRLEKKEALRRASEAFVNYDIPLPRSIQYLDDMGVLPFTKYFLSMQRILLQTMAEHPVKSLLTVMGGRYLHLMPTVMDSFWGGRITHNPFYRGPFRMATAFSEIMPIKGLIKLFKLIK